MDKFTGYWRKWKTEGDRVDIFDSREPLGIGHTKLWKFLMAERRLWRRYLSRIYGFSVRTKPFTSPKHLSPNDPSIPILEESPAGKMKTSQDVVNLWSRRRQCLRHPFYQALEQYLAVCECLEECGDPPELLANPRFTQYPERGAVLAVHGQQHVKSFLLREMRPTDIIPGETAAQYYARPHKTFRCRNVRGAFHSVYWPLMTILDPECGPKGDLDQFYGAFADTGISLQKAVRLKAALKLDGADPYQEKRQLLPAIVESLVLPQLWEINDPLEREAAFRRLPGKAAYALEKALGATKKRKKPATVQLNDDTISDRASLEERVAREQMSEEQLSRPHSSCENERPSVIALLSQLTLPQREVFVLHEANGLTLKAIALQLNKEPGTVASHYARAKKKISNLRPK